MDHSFDSSNTTINTIDGDVSSYSNPYFVGWTTFQILLSISFLCSFLTFCLTQFHHRIKTTFYSRLMKYLTGQDSVWTLICLVQCSINSHQGVFYGGYF